MDYASYLIHEANGSTRLNKISRSVIFKYCPFPRVMREKFAANPQYSQIIEQYRIKRSAKVTPVRAMIQKLENKGQDVPEEIREEYAFLTT